ncbi:Zinc finger MYM-type protein 1-like [Oopsacas minuta]|uniref:Zinc finger MYM-type protein 1-like n=1 Tax=Oopsacas minuta TaxID=111878 RepID=A0AAV7KLS9_9METZ|nr:Zinc finger MYM-type protein 1-like [Oopsacas minuta]
MSTTSKESNNSFVQGFNDWRHFDRVKCDENSLYHRQCTLDLIKRKGQHGHVNSELNISIESERVYWSQVLKRVIAVVKFLRSNGLASAKPMRDSIVLTQATILTL